nr:cytochrome c oxidase assembly protein COX20, mitochondrial-like [Nomia melanderi]
MAEAKITEPGAPQPSINLFGIPIIQTKCQGDSLFYGILGGFAGGLTTYLFTSQAKNSMHTGMICYVATTLCYAFYCMKQFRETQKQMRLVKQMMYEASLKQSAETDTLVTYKPEKI